MTVPPKKTRKPSLKPRKKPEYSPEARAKMRANGQRVAAANRARAGLPPVADFPVGSPEEALAQSLGLSKPAEGAPAKEPELPEYGPADMLVTLDPKLKLEMAKRVLARRSLIQFTKRFYPQYTPGWVHYDIARRLEKFMKDVEDKKSPRLMLLVPPRHGKSELASIRFPAYALGHHPEWEIINCGYNLDLPMKFSRKVREIVRDPGYKPLFDRAQLDPDSQSAEAWNTTAGGGFTAAGVGGGITGKGATVLIIDDPIKNQEEADSIVTRDGLWDWYWSTAYSRLAPGGGILVIQCMTGDTPVLMADGTERPLETIKAGDAVATYRHGALSTSTVRGVSNNGRDKVYKITTSSGRVVRANERHPFLAVHEGNLKWVRTRALTTANKIVTLRASGVSGKALHAPQTGASSPLSAGAYAIPTITSKNGLTVTALQVSTPRPTGSDTSNTDTASTWLSTDACTTLKADAAPCAEPISPTRLTTGRKPCALTTITTQELCGGSYAIHVTSQSDILALSPLHVPLLNTSDFILDPVVSVEFAGEEDVFDLAVLDTENFISNGLVTHNTWWHDDDLAGRLQQKMRHEADTDQFTIIKYPALAEKWEYRNKETDLIERYEAPMADGHAEQRAERRNNNVTDPMPIDEKYDLLRAPGEALHPERYNEKMMNSMRANQPPRIWSALYQQNPVPDEGVYFKKEYFRYEPVSPIAYNRNVFQAWDFAIGEKQQNDFTVGVTLVQDENDFLHLVDVVRFKGDSFTIVEAMLDAAERWGSEPTAPLTLGVEDSQIWKAIKPLFEKRMQERSLYPPYEVLKPLTDKLSRSRSLQGRMQQGRVYFPSEASWLGDVQTELLRFPAGAHDDIVDAMAWAVNLCIGRSPKKMPTPKQVKGWRDKLGQFTEGYFGDSSHMAS